MIVSKAESQFMVDFPLIKRFVSMQRVHGHLHKYNFIDSVEAVGWSSFVIAAVLSPQALIIILFSYRLTFLLDLLDESLELNCSTTVEITAFKFGSWLVSLHEFLFLLL
jgi:formate hydrogenlyase subunit 4